MNKNDTRVSKFLSKILRHTPEEAGITLGENGWANIDALIKGSKGMLKEDLTLETIKRVVENNNKKRFVLSDDETKIRAAQGHSTEVKLDLKEMAPPDVLYHGTKYDTIDLIKKSGIKKMKRHAVHLSADTDTANNVADRRSGSSVILKVNAKKMFEDGHKFFISDNGVWLTDHVPYEYVTV